MKLTIMVFVAAVLLMDSNVEIHLTDFDMIFNGFSFEHNIIVPMEEFSPQIIEMLLLYIPIN